MGWDVPVALRWQCGSGNPEATSGVQCGEPLLTGIPSGISLQVGRPIGNGGPYLWSRQIWNPPPARAVDYKSTASDVGELRGRRHEDSWMPAGACAQIAGFFARAHQSCYNLAREGARVDEWGGLENRCGACLRRGFESHPSRLQTGLRGPWT